MRQNNEMNVTFFVLVVILAAFCVFAFSGCSHQEQRSPLVRQVLRPRLGFNGLTNRLCLERVDFKGCQKWDTKNYDLHEPMIRKQLVDFGFRCFVAGERFKICPDTAGLCRYETVDECWLCKSKVVIARTIPIEEIEYLINAGTYCYSEREDK